MKSDVRAAGGAGDSRARADARGAKPVFPASPPIQADINTIDCNWPVMCGI